MSQKTIPYSQQHINKEDEKAVLETLNSSYLTQGPKVAEFEAKLCEITGAKHAVAVSNGTAALHLACMGLQIGPQKIGITSPISFAASANCLLYCGAEVQFCDVDPITGLMCPKALTKLLQKIQPQKGTVIPVSLGGDVGRLKEISQIARSFGFSVIEDAAQSLCAYSLEDNEKISSASCAYTDAATLSFHPVKHICAAEGGAVTTNNPNIAEQVRLLRSHGIIRPYVNEQEDPVNNPPWFYQQIELGFNYRLSDLHAALGLSQSKRADTFFQQRQTLAKNYHQHLCQEPFSNEIKLLPHHNGHAYHLFVVHFKNERRRNEAHLFLKDKGILTQVHHVPIYKHPYYENRFGQKNLPGAECYYDGCLSLPMFPKMSPEDQERVIDALHAFCEAGTLVG